MRSSGGGNCISGLVARSVIIAVGAVTDDEVSVTNFGENCRSVCRCDLREERELASVGLPWSKMRQQA